jgi:hypothetical protein
MKAISVITQQTNADETATANTSQLEDEANKLQEEISEYFQKDIKLRTLQRHYYYSYLRIFCQYQIQLLPCAVIQALFFNKCNVQYLFVAIVLPNGRFQSFNWLLSARSLPCNI